jgi:hypothetical protein
MDCYVIEELKQKGEWDKVRYISAHGLVPFVKKLNKNKIVGLEIGVASGWNMHHFLENIPQLDLTGIDPYLPFNDWNEQEHTHELLQTQYQAALKNISQFKNRARIVKGKSEDLYNTYRDNHFDYIFIDGGHTYESVLSDCNNYYSKVKSGGIFSGHDAILPDVKRALEDFRKDKALPPIWYVKEYVWFWIKE